MPAIPTSQLLQSKFAPFGVVSENPRWSSDLTTRHQSARMTLANQGTAHKITDIGVLQHSYPSGGPIRTSVALFTCQPRNSAFKGPDSLMPIVVMERHPYTTQSFCPLGLARSDTSSYFVIVVAPNSSLGTPDMPLARAYIAHGGQAVTYGANVWHSPMIVIGRAPVDFIVHQFVNGVPSDDCQEVTEFGIHNQTFHLSLSEIEDITRLFEGAEARI